VLAFALARLRFVNVPSGNPRTPCLARIYAVYHSTNTLQYGVVLAFALARLRFVNVPSGNPRTPCLARIAAVCGEPPLARLSILTACE